MSSCQRVARPLIRSIGQDRILQANQASFARSFSSTVPRKAETTAQPVVDTVAEGVPATKRHLDREKTFAKWAERKLYKMGKPAVGSRRRRAAIASSENIPFEQLPYQCFQEARTVLHLDRQEKLKALALEVAKIKKLEATPADQVVGGEHKKNLRLSSLRKYVEELKVLADINDPIVKRKFEDGLGDMSKPIYRHLAEKKWRGMPFRMITQRISQLNIIPDVLPKFEPNMEVDLYFRRNKVEPGEVLSSLMTEVVPRLRVQVFNSGERLVSVVVMDSDVPNAETDSFDRRCHYMAANIPISPTVQSLPLGHVSKDKMLAVPWLPAFSQKGAPYHRLSIFILEQKPGQVLDVAKLRELYSARDGFSLKSFRDKFSLTPVGFNIFRTVWDEHTAAVMERAGMPGADIEFKHKRVYSLKEPKKARGWEAKRQKPKYRDMWKYSKRIHGIRH